jgi:hypothetical protein
MQELLALSPRPTAVFAASDLIAVGAILAIKKLVCACRRILPWLALMISRWRSSLVLRLLRWHSSKQR